jgi:methylated-DNA-[protein]-cysteine S-methyltransferase
MPEGFVYSETRLIKKAAAQIDEYFAGLRKTFALPFFLHGTEFQKDVWNALQNIPYGGTCSYKDIAAAIGRPKAARAVGLANNRNPVSIIVPCHRVIGSNGALVGYGGGLPLKQHLLELEQQYK